MFKFGNLEKNVKAYGISKGNAVMRLSGCLFTKNRTDSMLIEK